jgi:hypothetical protein
MTRDEKALLYDDLVREGDRLNRHVAKFKAIIDRNPQEQAQLEELYGQLAVLEGRLNALFLGE